MLTAALFGSTYHLHLRYPRDASFVLLLVGVCWGGLLYISTLLLQVQYRGDFGVLIVDARSEAKPTKKYGILDEQVTKSSCSVITWQWCTLKDILYSDLQLWSPSSVVNNVAL